MFCCLTEEQKDILKKSGDHPDADTIYRFQKNLVMEKKTVKCTTCGRKYPRLQVMHDGEMFQPEDASSLKKKSVKCKLAADLFFDDHYYAFYKKSVVRIDLDENRIGTQTKDIYVPGGACQAVVSEDEKYMAVISLSGTLTAIDLENQEVIAKQLKNKKTVPNYKFDFDENNRLLVFSNDEIISWDVANNFKDIIWSAPKGDNYICVNVIHDRTKKTVMFYCLKKNEKGVFYDKGAVIIVKDCEVNNIIPIDGKTNNGKLSYSENLHRYSLCIDDEIRIYDDDFNVIEKYSYPYFVQYSDGGGLFPITRFGKNSSNPGRVHMSPDGKWILLDYFTEAILMNQETKEPVLYLYSYTGSPYSRMGFTDKNLLWYIHGNSTYILNMN